MANKNIKKTKKPTRKPVSKRVKRVVAPKTDPVVHQAKSGPLWTGEGWDAVESRTRSESDLLPYTLPTPQYTPVIVPEPSELDRVVSQIEPYCKKYLKFSLTETIQFVRAQWCKLKKFSEDNPATFGIGFVIVFTVLIGLIASL
jgi:hypothetical protein